MTDVIDAGCEREQDDRERALAAQRNKPKMEPVGFCYNCDELVNHGCFCDSDCRDDFERRARAARLNKQGCAQ